MPNNPKEKRAKRIRKKLKKINFERFRLTVHKSTRNISAQIIDDNNNKTLVSASSLKQYKANKKKSRFISRSGRNFS